jgi:hypothetical protein
MAETGKHTDDLDLLFAASRRDTESIPTGLSQRILTDADQVQAEFGVAGQRVATHIAPLGWWRQMLAALGGWPTVSGLATACAAGVWIGLAPPSFMPDPAQLVLGAQSDIELVETYDLVMALAEEQ